MAKGDGWAVKRYKCPKCFRKGLHYYYTDSGKFRCMYRNCSSNEEGNSHMFTREEVNECNPELKDQAPKFKP